MSDPHPFLEALWVRYGGLDRWRQLARIRARFSSGGLLFASRGQRHALRNIEVELDPHRCRGEFFSFPHVGSRGAFDHPDVRLANMDGTGIRERKNARRAFCNARHNFYWDHLDVLYFAGYAIWNYLCFPFLLASSGVAVKFIEPPVASEWRSLRVEFPPGFATHSAQQEFHIHRATGFLERHEYVAEVVGKWAAAAQVCDGYREFDGFLIATRRRVYPRWGRRKLPWPVLVWIEIHEVEFR